MGFSHSIMQTYYNMLVDVATILGAEPSAAKREMRELIQFETELAEVKGRFIIIREMMTF